MTSTHSVPTTVRRQVSGAAVWFLRISILLVTASVLIQPVLAGLFVTGEVGLLTMHAANASLIALLVLVQLVAAILVRTGGGPGWPIWATVAFFVLVLAQTAIGYARVVALHIPVGVLMFGVIVGLLIATWSPRPREHRYPPRDDSRSGR